METFKSLRSTFCNHCRSFKTGSNESGKNSCNQRDANLRVAHSCPRSNPSARSHVLHSAAPSKEPFLKRKVLPQLDRSPFLSIRAYSRKVRFLFFTLLSSFLKHNSLNIGCGIKVVTNQADGERCHTVSVLQGHWLSLRKPTSSAVTSNSGGTQARAAAHAQTQKPHSTHARPHRLHNAQ